MKRHRLDPFSLVFGATFAIVGALFLFPRIDVVDLRLHWIWPVPLIVLGVLIIALSMREGRTREITTSEPSTDIEEEQN
jgi:cytochrome c-type biogenesis protein CcmH/NrfF